ncbi:long-chain-fatty-acid--CoA ligase [Marinobacterium mangrovicola]|uniref:Fatty-acyl-CoA synthase n=1 Tax=Marinobacterium mangrovicola TaxID=1476959 RepID=A0A4R1GEU2_9GAMM|nr:long-chain-fatty-acid--CoA ligase [Marinobacterium mangrovicola]TCK04319.1 fatty-acyl-CoA synthase [Marinobacterium mangrovicola]
MYKKNFKSWPPGMPHEVALPTETVFSNLEKAYRKHPEKIAMVFYETEISYRELYESSCRMAGWLTQHSGVGKGDRVGIFSQNSPQYVIAFYAILCAGGVAVPMNPMSVEEELAFLLEDSGAKALFAATELNESFEKIVAGLGVSVIGIEYSDYLRAETDLPVPEFVSQPPFADSLQSLKSFTRWRDALAQGEPMEPVQTSLDDLVMLPYTSGSTGNPKGCMHDSVSAQHAMRAIYDWFGIRADDSILVVAPMFHVVGLQAGMNSTIAQGATMVILPRWDRTVAAHAIHNYRVTVWPTVPAMVIDLINAPDFDKEEIASLRVLLGGGASMPEAVAEHLHQLCGLTYHEGWGMTETGCPGTTNPLHAPKSQCGGLPCLNSDVRIVDFTTLEDMPVGEVGEVLFAGPQLCRGYWQNDAANAKEFVELDGVRYLRTGDLGRMDEDGYLFLVDRIKRMINASGYKVWPSQVETVLHRHPAVQEACVIAAQDEKRGETVKALIVLKREYDLTTPESIIEWSREHMAAYKIPRIVEFIDALPKSGSGKILWRRIQEMEDENKKKLADLEVS